MSSEENAFGALLDEYIVECLPLAEGIADTFVELERLWRAGDPGDALLPGVKGNLHTVKGNSAMMGLTPMQNVAHALEDVCARVSREPELRRDDTAGLLVAGGGLLVELIRSAASGDGAGPSADFVAQVRDFLKTGTEVVVGGISDRRTADRRTAERREGGAAPANVVRVDFRRLDTLLEVLGEGMIEHATLIEAYRRVIRKTRGGEELEALGQTIVTLEKTLKRLESVVMGTRLLPISTVFNRFPRLVRDVAHSEQKQVRLVATGGDTSLDKAVLDRLSEPLIHLLSNAVVHGIESPHERQRAGKPPEATLELVAASQSSRVVIRLSDDGRGLDEEKILAKAEALGLELRGSGPEQIQSVIFLPGFSTAQNLSQLAGRGVGLDVVATCIHGLGGTIEVESRPGRGVSFTLDLPLTLAIVRSLIVEVDRERYAVPISHVAETVRVTPDAIHEINQRGVALWRGDLIHVADGGTLLGTGEARDGGRRFYIVISSGGKRRGVLVDRLVGHQDVVVKGLDPTLGRPEVVSGTTILGDGRVACILDAVRILEQRGGDAPRASAQRRIPA